MNSNFVRLPFINNKNGKYEYVDDVGCLRDGRDMCDVCVAADPRDVKAALSSFRATLLIHWLAEQFSPQNSVGWRRRRSEWQQVDAFRFE